MADEEVPIRAAIVTGAGRGIGRSIALGLAEAGYHVVLVARNARELEAVHAEITDAGGVATAVPTDVASPTEVEHLSRAIEGIPIAVLVNAAGVFGPLSPIVTTDLTAWTQTIGVNLLGVVHMTRAFAPGMVEAGWGRILNVSSAAALHPPGPLNSAYATSKVAVNQFTRHLASELRGTGVTANVFHPGDVRTHMFEGIRQQTDDDRSPEAGGDYGRWVQWMDDTGGDPAHKAVDLVLRVISDTTFTPNGEFLWIDEPLQAPVPSWPAEPEEAKPWGGE